MAKIVKSKDAAGRYPAFEPSVLTGDSPGGSHTDDAPDAPSHEEVIAALKAEAEEHVREAYAEGLRRGEEAGREAFEARVAEAAEALTTAAHAMQRARQQFLDSLEPEVMNLVRLVTERVVRREMRTDRDLIERTVRAALELMLECERVTLLVNPEDLAALKEQQVTLLEEFEGIEHLEIRADGSVEPGGCIADAPTMQVDGAIKSQLQRVFDAMLE